MKLKKLLTIGLACLFIASFSACSKSNDPTPEEEPDPEISETMFNRLITVKNFGEDLPEGSAPDSEQAPIYFSLEENKAVDIKYNRTNRWDIAFSSVYRSSITANNGTDPSNYGKGGPGKGGILLVPGKFEDIIDIPVNGNFRTRQRAYGTDDNGDLGQGYGWYLYDFGGLIVRDGEYDNQHIAYPLDEPLEIKKPNGEKKIVEPRTIIVRTARGNYAKIRIRSIYKDKLERDSWKRKDPAPFFTFEYVLAKAGSTKFEIK